MGVKIREEYIESICQMNPTASDIHGGGSPEAHRVTILRETNVEKKKKAAKRLAGIED